MVRDFGIALPICGEREDSPSQSGLITRDGERASATRKADTSGSSFRITESTEALGVPGEFMCDGLGLAALESQPSIRCTACCLSAIRSWSLVLLGAARIGAVVLEGTHGAMEPAVLLLSMAGMFAKWRDSLAGSDTA